MTKARINPWTNYKDISFLTPYEQTIYDLLQEGLSYAQIAERIGNKPLSVKSRIPAIREKVQLQHFHEKQSRYSTGL